MEKSKMVFRNIFLAVSVIAFLSLTLGCRQPSKNDSNEAIKVTITVQGDQNVASGKGESFTVEKGVKWEQVKTRPEITGITFKDDFDLLQWKLDNESGNDLTDDYVFDANAIVFAQTQKRGSVSVPASISMSLSSNKMDIEVLVITKNNTPVTVEGCTQSSLENNALSTLNAVNQEVVLKGEIIKLVCDSNQIKALNIQNGNELKELSCKQNELTSLDLHGLENLEILYCQENNIKNLNVQNCASLDILDFKFNKTEVLNISGCQALRIMYCEDNNLTALDLQGFANLSSVECQNNKLVSLNAKGVENLEKLDCKENVLTYLDVDGCTALSYLNCAMNKLKTINVKRCENLVNLYCYENELTHLDLQDLANIVEVNCEKNLLTSFNADGCTSLRVLAVRKNKLTTLSVKNLHNLSFLSCHTNKLTVLDVQDLRNLARLHCHTNELTDLNIEGTTSLIELSCFGNNLNAKTFEKIFTDLPSIMENNGGKCTVYTDKTGATEGNHKDFNDPQTLKDAFNNAKSAKKWMMFKIIENGDKEKI